MMLLLLLLVPSASSTAAAAVAPRGRGGDVVLVPGALTNRELYFLQFFCR